MRIEAGNQCFGGNNYSELDATPPNDTYNVRWDARVYRGTMHLDLV
jgi:hypothetical protein